MNHKHRTFITIVCSILLIMPSFLGVPLADGNLVLVPTPDNGQVNDEISTITDLNDENIKTIVTTELLLQADSDESDLSYSSELQEHAIRAENGNEENVDNSIPAEHLEGEESDQVGQSNVAEEITVISQEQLPVENESEPSPSWPLIPDLSAIGNYTDNVDSIVDPETPHIDDVNSTLLNDVLLLDDVNHDSLTLVNSNQDTLTINTTTPTVNLESNTSDSSPHAMSDGYGIANNEIDQQPVESDDISSTIAENPQIPTDLSANDFVGSVDSLVDSTIIQGVDEIVADNNGESTTFTSESSAIEESDSNSVDSVTTVVSNTNSGSNGEDDNDSNYGRSDENHNDGRCSDNSIQDHSEDKHKHKEKNNNKDGDKGNGEARENEHHAGSESSHDHDEDVSHNDSNHQNRKGSDDDRNRHDHEDEHENSHDDDDHEEHDHDEEHNDE
jgi:hypothetical protein